MSRLLSSDGTLLCRDKKTGVMLHRKLTASLDDVDVVEIDDASRMLSANFGHYMRDDVSTLRLELNRGFLSGWTITRAPDQRSLTFSRNGHWLIAEADSEAVKLTADRTLEPARFLPIGQPDLAVLTDMLAGQWLIQSADAGMPPQSGTLTPGFGLSVGPLAIDLRWNLPFDRSEWPHRLPVLRDGWRIDKIHRYRPLIYYAAFGAASIMQQFALNLASLVAVGAYDGAIVVMTDKTVAEIAALVPPEMRAPLVVLPMAACDRFAAIGARLTIGGWPDAWHFQPLLYVDTDILFDRPVAPMLWAIARSERMSVPIEPKERLASSVFVGNGLFWEDDCDPGTTLGFNFGTVGIPNLLSQGPILDLISRIIFNRAAMNGREALIYFDQAIANYVLFRLGKGDTDLISPFVRLADHAAEPTGRRGLVHYCWVLGAEVRVELMRSYLHRLLHLDAAEESNVAADRNDAADKPADTAAMVGWVEGIGRNPAE